MITAELLSRSWRRVDVKLAVDGRMHALRWRRGWFADEVLFDDRRVALAEGLFSRETMYGLNVRRENGDEERLLFIIDPAADHFDFSGSMRPRGVRLETADRPLVAIGSLGPDRMEPFRKLYDEAVKALGLA